MTRIVRLTRGEAQTVLGLASALWPEHETAALLAELEKYAADEDAALFAALEGGGPVAFAQCTLRKDYVEGAETSPVGYLEGIFVDAPFRRKGIGRKLVGACEEWSRKKGAVEFGSDCESENASSAAFHKKAGFAEAGRIICFIRKL